MKKIYVIHGPSAPERKEKILEIIGNKSNNYSENFSPDNPNWFVGPNEVDFAITRLNKPIEVLEGEFNTALTILPESVMPDIIIESEILINLDVVNHPKVAEGFEYEIIEINLFKTELGLTNEFSLIRDWASEKGIFKSGDLKTQALKLLEEAGELAKAIINNDKPEVEDAIGDCTVVLTNVAELAAQHFNDPKISIESCTNGAYQVIANRTGKMENGSFVKDS